MASWQYTKGVRKERKIVNDAKKRGCIALRSAGSKSPIDVVVIDHKRKIIQLIQSKGATIHDSTVRKLYKENEYLDGRYQVGYVVL